MKNLLNKIVLAAACLASFSSSAELLIYKGVLTEKYYGAYQQEHRSWKAILIVDHQSGYFARIGFATLNGAKRYFIGQYTNSHIIEVTGPALKTATAITHIPNDCQVQESPGVEGIYFKGMNSTVTVNVGAPIAFPRVLTGGGASLSHTTTSDLPYLSEGGYTLVFNQAETIKSNQAGETLDDASARLIAALEALGYSQ